MQIGDMHRILGGGGARYTKIQALQDIQHQTKMREGIKKRVYKAKDFLGSFQPFAMAKPS